MEKDEIINNYTKDSNGFFWGVFGDNLNFFIADRDFNVIVETPAFSKGNFTKEVKQTMKKFGIDDVKSRMRTDDNIEALKDRIDLDVRICEMYKKRTT
jgi:hypothetical protein